MRIVSNIMNWILVVLIGQSNMVGKGAIVPGQPFVFKGSLLSSGDLPGGATTNEMYMTYLDGHGWYWNGSAWVDYGVVGEPLGAIPQKVMVLKNDDTITFLTEPSDDASGEIADNGQTGNNGIPDQNPKYSMVLAFCNQLVALTGRPVFVVPCARGSSALNYDNGLTGSDPYLYWEKRTADPDPFIGDRSTLFNNAISRTIKAMKWTGRSKPSFILHYQVEAQAYVNPLATLVADEQRTIAAFRSCLGQNIPVFAFQGGPALMNSTRQDNINEAQLLKRQMGMATLLGGGANSAYISNYYVLPSHFGDVRNPDSDHIHLAAPSLDTIGRFAAYRVNAQLYGGSLSVPQVTSVSRSTNTVVLIDFSAALLLSGGTEYYGTDYWKITYNGNTYRYGVGGITAIDRPSSQRIRLTLANAMPSVGSGQVVTIEYSRPYYLPDGVTEKGDTAVTDYLRANASPNYPVLAFRESFTL